MAGNVLYDKDKEWNHPNPWSMNELQPGIKVIELNDLSKVNPIK